MSYSAKFTHGTRTFDLNSSEYDLYTDFVFPAADEALNIGSGTSGNRSGGNVVSKRPQDRWWAWSVVVQGTSEAQTHNAARRLSAWLNQALEDTSSKVYFEYRTNADIPEPIWGQHGAAYRWEVKAAIVDLDGSYYSYEWQSAVLILPISLMVGPHAKGARQKMSQAMGAVFEDTYGVADGLSRGTVINGALTNLVVNPSFETNTTGWTAVDSTLERTADQAWVGNYGMRMTVNTTGTNASAYATANTGTPLAQQNYVMSARVYTPAQMVGYRVNLRLSESGGASAAEITAEISSYFTVPSEGWHYLKISGTLKKADRTTLTAALYIMNTGSPPAGSWVIWDAIQVVGPNIFNIYPYIDGDKLGCAWTGTAHASTSTSTAGYCRLPVTASDVFDMRQGTVCAVMKMPYASTDVPSANNNRVFYTNTALRVMYYQTDGKFYIHDNTASVGVSASWAAGDIIVIHATWGPAGMKVYFNATASASEAYVNPGAAAYVYIGSNASSPPTERILATFLDFTVWNTPFTAAQVTSDYANISPHIRGGDGKGQRLSGLNWLWTKDGDNIVDNYYDATHSHIAIIGGVPGTTEAETEIKGVLSGAKNTTTLSNYATRNYFNPISTAGAKWTYKDLSGSADAVETAVGGEAYVFSATTSEAGFMGAFSIGFDPTYDNDEIGFCVIARIRDVGTDYIRIRSRYATNSSVGGNTTYYSDYSRPYSTATKYRLYRTPILSTMLWYASSASINLYGYRAGSDANLYVDFVCVLPEPYATLKFSGSGSAQIYLVGNSLIGGDFIGNPIEFVPNKYNLLQSFMGDDSHEHTLATTLTYTLYVTPRYSIL